MCSCNGYVNNFQKASGCMDSEYTTLPFGYGRCHGCKNDEYSVKGYFEGTISVERKGGCSCNKPSYIVTPIYDTGFGGCSCNKNMCGFDDGFSVNPIGQGGCQKNNCSNSNLFNTFCFCKMFK